MAKYLTQFIITVNSLTKVHIMAHEETKTEESATKNDFQELATLFQTTRATYENATPVIMKYYMAKHEFNEVEQKFIHTMVAVHKAGANFDRARFVAQEERNKEFRALSTAEPSVETQDRITVLENEQKTVSAMLRELNSLDLLHARYGNYS